MLDWDAIDLEQVFIGGVLLTISIVLVVFESLLPTAIGVTALIGLWGCLSVVSIATELKSSSV